VRAADRGRMVVNRRMWDEAVPLHVDSPSYAVPRFRTGWIPLLPLELKEVGSVRGRTLLHLQCHFGMDTLSWARLGARVTGVDYSPPAIRAAVRLAREVGIEARFVESNVYDVTRRLRGRFDLVYTGKGALCWLPDLPRWAETVAHFLRPGGRLFYLEDHPVAELFEWLPAAKEFVRRNRYFQREPIRDETLGTYAAPEARLRHAVSFSWVHPISEVLTSLLRAGLRIESFTEFPYTYWHRYPPMREDRQGYWHLNGPEGSIPLMYSLSARKPGGRP
jgi:SAM-dependent methyltransferase